MPDGADDDDPTFDTANSTVARLRALQSSQEQRLKLTREELLRFETQLLWLVNSGIRLRYQRRGRWRKEDTARRTYVYTIALPNLRRGKLPPVLDWEFLFMDPGRPADEKSLFAVVQAFDEMGKRSPPGPALGRVAAGATDDVGVYDCVGYAVR
jgi:hypothetical protein